MTEHKHSGMLCVLAGVVLALVLLTSSLSQVDLRPVQAGTPILSQQPAGAGAD